MTVTMARKRKSARKAAKAPPKTPPKPVDPRWAARLDSLQKSLKLSNSDMSAKFGVEPRTYVSWKYGERNLSPSAAIILSMLESGK